MHSWVTHKPRDITFQSINRDDWIELVVQNLKLKLWIQIDSILGVDLDCYRNYTFNRPTFGIGSFSREIFDVQGTLIFNGQIYIYKISIVHFKPNYESNLFIKT